MTNAKSSRRPTFIHVGPPRTATTWLYEVMLGHVGLPRVDKETRFFDAYYDRGIDWYCNLLEDYSDDVPGGEFAPTYFSNALARDRIKSHIPNCKIIVTFRDPAARLYSMYRLYRRQRTPVSDTFDEYSRLQLASGSDWCSYATHLKRWQAAFGKSGVLVLFYEDLNSDPQGYLDTVCDFVGARRISLARSNVARKMVHTAASGPRASSVSRRAVETLQWVSNHGARPLIELSQRTPMWKMIRRMFVEDFPPLSDESADEIRAIAMPETEDLELITGRDLSHWKSAAHRKLESVQGVRSVAR
jgi:hypothetical protein